MPLKIGGFYQHVPSAILENEDDDGISVVTAHAAVRLPEEGMYLVVAWCVSFCVRASRALC